MTLREVVEYLLAEIVRVDQHHASRGGGGQRVQFHGDFASATPGVMSALQRWAREAREAISEHNDASSRADVADRKVAALELAIVQYVITGKVSDQEAGIAFQQAIRKGLR